MKINKTKALLFFILLVSDIICIVLSLYLAYHSRFHSVFVNVLPITRGLPEYVFYKHLLYFILPLWLLIFFQHKMYRTFFLPALDDLIRVFRAVSLSVIFTLLAIFFYREFSYSRGVLALFWMYSIASIYLARQLVRYFVKYGFRTLIERESILVVGVNNKMIKDILKQYHYKKCFFFPNDDESYVDDIKAMCRQRDINEVILTNYNWPQNALLSFYDWCETNGIDLRFIPDIVQLCRGEVVIDSSLGIPTFRLRPISLSGFDFYFKRVIDLFISTLILAFIWPILWFISILIRLDSTGPSLYHHKRVGYRGRQFDFFKFRSMVTNADALLTKFRDQSERKGPVFKMKNDPRITLIGKFLRRFSIDELPQLLNVLRGDMSLVGPRPQVLWEAAAYDDWAKRRLRVLPGITGLWQVSGRADLSYEEMIELDIYYIENWSLGMDLSILSRTLPAIFSKKGAC